ncbi:MAG: peptidoglycan-binding domain-containing protein [Candidatus Omnitrophota bacterium]|jgi:peptidoglycan hydrolase-like protein with peptidoglycan-binding domain
MKKLAYLLVFVLMFSISCAKKAEKTAETSLEAETIMSEGGPITLEAQPQGTSMVTKEGVPVEMGRDALSAQIPVETMGASEKSTPENIQTALKNAGVYTGSVDGKIGPKTKKAIEAFQQQNGLTVDGKVGPKTWDKLKNYLNKVAEPMPEPINN